MFVEHLPRDAALWRDIDPKGTAWSDQEYLLALIVDVLNVANWQRGGDKHASHPRPIYRPGDRVPVTPTPALMADMKARIAEWDEQHRGGDE